jgi:hypothetical protein
MTPLRRLAAHGSQVSLHIHVYVVLATNARSRQRRGTARHVSQFAWDFFRLTLQSEPRSELNYLMIRGAAGVADPKPTSSPIR